MSAPTEPSSAPPSQHANVDATRHHAARRDEIQTQTDASPHDASRGGVLAIIIIVLATVLAYWPVFNAEFTIRDDDHNVSQNPDMKPPSIPGVLRYWKRPFWGLYTPVTHTVWSGVALLSPHPALPNQPYQLNAVSFHATNVAFHALSAVFAYFVLRRLFRHVGAACCGALLFALHPIQVDAVGWVSGLKDVLAGCFALLAVWQYLLSADESLDQSDRKFHYAMCLIATTLAVLSKVSASMLPGIVLVMDWLLLRRSWRTIARGVIPLAIICLPLMILGRFAQNPESRLDIYLRPVLVLFTLSFYMMKIVWPVALAPDYGLAPAVAMKVSWIWACWIIPLLVAIALWLTRRRRPELLAGALVFLVSFLPVMGFFAFFYQSDSTVGDHYLYLALFGPAIAVAGSLARLTPANRVAWYVVAAAVLIALGARTSVQASQWRNTLTLFTHNARVTPNNWRPVNHVGLALLEQKKPREAEQRFRESIALQRTHVNVANLAAARLAQGDVRDAIDYLNEAARLEPNMPTYQVQLADIYLRNGRPADAAAAAQRALELKPDDTSAKRLLEAARKARGGR